MCSSDLNPHDLRRNIKFVDSKFLSLISDATFPATSGAPPILTSISGVQIFDYNNSFRSTDNVDLKLFNQSDTPIPKLTYDGLVSCGTSEGSCDIGIEAGLPPELSAYFDEAYVSRLKPWQDWMARAYGPSSYQSSNETRAYSMSQRRWVPCSDPSKPSDARCAQ